MSELYLVRHGQSAWNLEGLVQGQTAHPGLTDLGRAQAQEAADVLAADLAARGLRADRVISSDLRRAFETAEVVAERLGLRVETDVRLREQGLGWLEGRAEHAFWEVAAGHDWQDPDARLGDGESVAEVLTRVAALLGELGGAEVGVGGVTVLVTHANTIRALEAAHRGAASVDRPTGDLPNGGVRRVSGASAETVLRAAR